MAKSVRISDSLYALAELESRLEHRSIAQQLEHWAKLGMTSHRAASGTAGSSSLLAAIETTRRLDILDVQSGRLNADALHFIPRSLAKRARPDFSKPFQKG